MAASTSGRRNRDWAWHPDIPMPVVPLFDWPWRPLKALRYLLSLAFLWSQVVPFAILAIVVWEFTQPALERCRELEAGWIAWMYLRNLGLMILIAGGLHLFFHTFRAQGDQRKFDSRDLARNDARFFTGNQTRDNIFWSCTSGVGIWTAYEVIMMWGYANGWFPHFLVWHENPVLFVAWFLVIPFWSAVHFYVIHRLLHWKPLFRIAHALHHRNVTVGPWSGLSMHPIEHVIYLSGVFIHAAVLSHPVHVLFHGQYNTLQAATSHTGFDSILVRGKPVHYAGSFFHTLHHRYYNCNYGNQLVPMDKWFGSYHDGTPETWARLRRRMATRPAATAPGRGTSSAA